MTYDIVCIVIFLFLAVVWKSDNWPNMFFKVLFIGMLVWSILSAAVDGGYVVKTNKSTEPAPAAHAPAKKGPFNF